MKTKSSRRGLHYFTEREAKMLLGRNRGQNTDIRFAGGIRGQVSKHRNFAVAGVKGVAGSRGLWLRSSRQAIALTIQSDIVSAA
jgi:hypothetical protein